ncbi:hypothetical protein ACFC02_30185, partial [Streptomyces sp. NPDC056160]
MTNALRIPPVRAIAAICALGGSALLMTACSNGSTGSSVAEAAEAAPASASPSPSASLSKDQAERRDLLAKAHVGWAKAAGTAVKEVSGGKLVSIELKKASHNSTSSPAAATSPGTASPTGSPTPSASAGAPPWGSKEAPAHRTRP